MSRLDVVVFPTDTTAPSVPTITAVTAVSSSRLDITWSVSTDAQSGLGGYRIYSATSSGGTYTLLDTLSRASLSYSHTGLSASTTRWYRVLAVDAVGNVSAQSTAVSGTTQTASSGFPDLQALYGVPWTIAWPTAPVITNGEQVVTPANIATYQNVSGLRLLLSAGTYPGFTMDNNVDQEWVVGSNVNFTGAINVNTGTLRCKWKWTIPRDPTSQFYVFLTGPGQNPVDFLLDGANTDCTGSGAHFRMNGTRYSIINSWIRSGSYNLWSESQSFDCNLYNSIFEGGAEVGNAQSACRITNPEKWAIARCRFFKHGPGLLIRIYTGSAVQFSDCQVDASEGGGSNDGCVIDSSGATESAIYTTHGVRFMRNALWIDSGGPLNTSVAGGNTRPVLLQDNNNHCSSSFPTTGPAGYTFVNNTNFAFGTPDAWSFL